MPIFDVEASEGMRPSKRELVSTRLKTAVVKWFGEKKMESTPHAVFGEPPDSLDMLKQLLN